MSKGKKESLGLHQRGHCREKFQEDILSWLPLGLLKTKKEVEKFVQEGREWIERENQRRHPRLDLFGEERSGCEAELLSAEQMLSCISNITIDGADLILDRVFDNVGFNRIGMTYSGSW